MSKKRKRNWLFEHVRPHLKWVGEEEFNIHDDSDTMFRKIEDNAEIGIKFKFKW